MFKKIVGLGFSTKGKNGQNIEKYISDLVVGGANEFFTGYNPPYWSDRFGFEVSPNGRFSEHEQITNYETLSQIIGEVHKCNLEIFINLNAWYYTDQTMPLIERMVNEFEDLGIDGIICGNIGILEYLKERNYKGKINISTILAVYNTESISFMLENYSINKVILSREVTLKEIEKLVTNFPKIQFEVFGEGDFCRYNNGLCFAEHKYGAKDICTIVVNDLIIKKRFHPDFKKIILDNTQENLSKIEALSTDYKDIFEQIEDILLFESPLPQSLSLGGKEFKIGGILEKLYKIIKHNKNRVDLFYDALKPITSTRNKNILIYLKGLTYILEHNTTIPREELVELIELKEELEKSVKTGLQYNLNKIKELGGIPKVKALELAQLYSKGDNLNLYTYLFFSQFKNIETVKFPTRGRNYTEKISLIESVLHAGAIDNKKLLDRGMSIERAHYDLTYLFGNKMWFREMLKDIY